MATIFLILGWGSFIAFGVCFLQWQTADRRGRSPSYKRGALILTLLALLITGVCILLFLTAQPSDAAALRMDKWSS